MSQTSDDQTLRKDAGKLRYDLIPPEWIEGLVSVLQMGAEKYEDNGWRKRIMEDRRVLASGMRHREAYRKGQKYDEESGLHHLLHSAWNDLCLYYYDITDRKPYEVSEGE